MENSVIKLNDSLHPSLISDDRAKSNNNEPKTRAKHIHDKNEEKTKEQNINESSKSLGRPYWPPKSRSGLNSGLDVMLARCRTGHVDLHKILTA